jgi:hypothetical protein
MRQMNSPRTKRHRDTPANQIIRFARYSGMPADVIAMFMADFGWKPTYRDLQLSVYCTELPELMKKTKMSKNSKYVMDLKASVEGFEKQICAEFLTAVRNCDASKIIEIADSVARFKGKFDADYQPADPERLRLLLLKYELQQRRKKMTVREVACFLYGDDAEKFSDDGFSALRRKCKELGFPLKPAKKIKTRK